MRLMKLHAYLKKSGLLLLTVIVGAATASITIQAAEVELEEIVVTGSRIARDPNLSGALPVQSITAEAIQLSGEFSITDVINDIPSLLMSVTSEQSIDAPGAFDDGANVLNLRGLGSERTLVLVDGRRHVGGLQGTASVDVGSIPVNLIERIEILTGGASAVYGADAVTGVVNFILKDDFEGFKIDAYVGISQDGDGEQGVISGIWGTNFENDRGNLTVAIDYRKDQGLQVRDRSNGARIGSSRDWVNPALRFQQGDIGGDTPNFANFYNYANTGLFNYGLTIPTRDDFIADYNDEFGVDPNLTAGEIALLDQAANAPQRAILPERTFPITSGYGYIIPGNAQTFDGFDETVDIDLDGNGTPDCLDSFSGYNSSFARAAFGIVGGCWNITEDGSYRPVRDGLVSGNFTGFGGDSFNTIQNPQGDIILPEEKISINLLAHYDLTPDTRVFAEFKYIKQETDTDNRPNSFYDLLPGFSDNPFLPAFIQPIADAIGAVAITIDPLAFPNRRSTDRDTTRIVVGIEGSFVNDWNYEVSANYGLFEQENRTSGAMIVDRFFAAIDAVTDPATGQPACRVDVDPTAPGIKTPFDLPVFDPGYYSFTPGTGACVPLNIWAGQGGVSAEAIAFVTTPQFARIDIDQLVFSGVITGDLDFFELPGGQIAFAAGAEYRKETSDARFDDWQRGIIPAGSPFPQGTQVGDVSDNAALTFDPEIPTNNEKGDYDVIDVFLETSLPILSNVQLAKELTLDLAVRYSDYSTIGDATTWKVNVVWAPIDALAFRGSVSQAVRAPNITELFGPETGTTFRPADPCDAAQIAAIAVDDPTLAANTQANCVADFATFGLDPFVAGVYSFTDPLSARIGGIRGGNRDLIEETADTITFGLVFQPEFLPGFSLTVDYWDIEIEDAIESVSGQNIVDGCYQAATLNQNFCQLFTRNTSPTSAQFGGFSFLRSTTINFARLEATGIDFAAKYQFNIGEHNFEIAVQGSDVDKLDFFTNPSDLSEVDNELGEVNRPEQAGNIYLTWDWGDWHVGWQAQYLGDQLVSFVEIDTAKTLYGDAVFMDELWIHDLNARYVFADSLTFYGGVKNITEEDPFGTDRAYPASPRGRFFFFGVNYQM